MTTTTMTVLTRAMPYRESFTDALHRYYCCYCNEGYTAGGQCVAHAQITLEDSWTPGFSAQPKVAPLPFHKTLAARVLAVLLVLAVLFVGLISSRAELSVPAAFILFGINFVCGLHIERNFEPPYDPNSHLTEDPTR